MKFTIDETSVDAAYQVAVNGHYEDGTEGVFQFNLDETPHSTKTEFLAAVKERVEAAQPVLSAEEQEKKDLAETAKALLDTYIGTEITLDAPVSN